MKKIIFALSFMTIMVSAPAIAQSETSTPTIATQNDDNGRKEIKYSELPQAVKDALAADYKGWEIDDKAYCVRKEDDTVKHYEVSVRNKSTDESRLVKFDPQGKVIAQ